MRFPFLLKEMYDSITAAISNLAAHMAEKVTDDVHGWESATRFKTGNFTRSTTTDSGMQAITGVGFKPKAILLFAAVQLAGRASIGFATAIGGNSVINIHNTTANTWATDIPISIRQGSDSSISYRGSLGSFDIDGFTINWTKGASAIDGETITIIYMALR